MLPRTEKLASTRHIRIATFPSAHNRAGLNRGCAILKGSQMNYIEAIKTDLPGPLQDASHGAAYLSRAQAEVLAGRPVSNVATFGDGIPMLPLFGGALVAVDFPLPPNGDGHARNQRTWCPVLDSNSEPIPLSAVTSQDIHDSLQRAVVQAIAMVTGVGAAPFLGFNQTSAMLEALGIAADSDLSAGTAYTQTNAGGAADVPWMAALIAARLTDPAFHWEVVTASSPGELGGIAARVPVYKVGNGWSVCIKAVYKGVTRSEWQPLGRAGHEAPTVVDWHVAVMRGLRNVIAYLTGYGIGTCTDEGAGREPPLKADGTAIDTAAQRGTPPTGVAEQPAGRASPVSPSATQGEQGTQQPPVEEPVTSEKLRSNLARIAGINDVVRLQASIGKAPALFGPEAPIFVKAVQERINLLTKVKGSIEQVATITDAKRLRNAIGEAESLFGSEAPAFIKAAQARITALETPQAA